MLIKVDLPAPFSPTMPVIAPLAMASDTPRTACTLPNDFWMPESSMALTAAISDLQPWIGICAFSAFCAAPPEGRFGPRSPAAGRLDMESKPCPYYNHSYVLVQG